MTAAGLLAIHKPTWAHQVEIVEDVGATLHIEPNDTPRAGEPVLAWFALTRRGGQPIPLANCDCQLSVYTQPRGDTASLTPSLSAVDAEGYQDIPGARLTFPAVGAYTLVLRGSPKQAEAFTPFELAFDVTVAAGQATAPAPATGTDDTPEVVAPIVAPTTKTPAAKADSSPVLRGFLAIAAFPAFLALVWLGGRIRSAIARNQTNQKP